MKKIKSIKHYKKIQKLYPQYTTVNYGELTVVTK